MRPLKWTGKSGEYKAQIAPDCEVTILKYKDRKWRVHLFLPKDAERWWLSIPIAQMVDGSHESLGDAMFSVEQWVGQVLEKKSQIVLQNPCGKIAKAIDDLIIARIREERARGQLFEYEEEEVAKKAVLALAQTIEKELL